jgi:hypothetical protein
MDRQNALMSDEFKAARDVLLANRAAYDVVRQAMNDTRKTRCALPGPVGLCKRVRGCTTESREDRA